MGLYWLYWSRIVSALSYSTAVPCIGFGHFQPQNITPKSTSYLLRGLLVRQSQAKKCFLTLHQFWCKIFKNLFNRVFCWLLTDLLIDHDLRNSIMAKATGFICSLFNIASFGNVPFCQLLLLQRLYHIVFIKLITFDLLWVLFLSPSPRKWRFVVCMSWASVWGLVTAVLAEAIPYWECYTTCSKSALQGWEQSVS